VGIYQSGDFISWVWGADYENDFHDIIAEPNGFPTTKDLQFRERMG